MGVLGYGYACQNKTFKISSLEQITLSRASLGKTILRVDKPFQSPNLARYSPLTTREILTRAIKGTFADGLFEHGFI
jgi:hypothetical protein